MDWYFHQSRLAQLGLFVFCPLIIALAVYFWLVPNAITVGSTAVLQFTFLIAVLGSKKASPPSRALWLAFRREHVCDCGHR